MRFIRTLTLPASLLAAIAGAHTSALRAAGAFNGSGKAISGVETFADAIKGNVIWAVSVFAGLAVALIGAMFMTGHSRAQDYALKAVIGFVVMAGATGIVA